MKSAGMGRSRVRRRRVRRVRTTTRWGHRIMDVEMTELSEVVRVLSCGWCRDGNAERRHRSATHRERTDAEPAPSSFTGGEVSGFKGERRLTSLDSLLVLRLCCMDRDSAMSVTGLWIFFRSPLYFTWGVVIRIDQSSSTHSRIQHV